MNKEEFLKSFPIEPPHSILHYEWIWGVFLLMMIGSTLVGFLIASRFSGGEIFKYMPLILLFVSIGILGQIVDNKFVKITENYKHQKQEWITSEFQKYRDSLQKENIIVSNYTINENGTVTVIVEGKKKINIIKDIKDIQHKELEASSKGHIEGTYVAGFDDYGLEEGYYDVVLYLPKEAMNK